MFNRIAPKTLLAAVGIALVLAAACYLYYRFDPARHAFFPKCPSLLLSGMKCPGCGSQRTLHALLHGNLAGAFSFNPLMVVSIPYLLLLLAAKIHERMVPYSAFSVRLHHPYIIRTYLAVVIIFWITRNIYHF